MNLKKILQSIRSKEQAGDTRQSHQMFEPLEGRIMLSLVVMYAPIAFMRSRDTSLKHG